MANPTITELKKLAKQRYSIIANSEKGLLSTSANLQDKLIKFIVNSFIPSLDISNGRVLNTNANLLKVKNAAKLRQFIKNVVNLTLLGYYDGEFEKSQKATNRYFNEFSPTSATIGRIDKRGSIVKDSFLESLFDNNSIVSKVQTTARNAVTSNQPVSSLVQLMNDQVEGKGKKFGLIESYHYNNGFNEFQDYSRGLDAEFAKALDLNYAIYAGGEIKTTRTFCDEHNGKVYNREEIEELGEDNWQGKKDNNNIFIDAGGYNCRHNWDFISYQLAKRIRPDIERSKYDKK